MNELDLLLAWMIIPAACFMVFYAVRDILSTNSEPNLALNLHRKAFHRKRMVG
jgi:hypothetical protein